MRILKITELLIIYIALVFFILMAFTYGDLPPNVESWSYDDYYNAQLVSTIRYLIIVSTYILLSGLLLWRILIPKNTLRILSIVAILLGTITTLYIYCD
jgi:hypothetical protein